MTTYRIDILTGWSVYDSLVSREYRQFNSADDAKQYAANKVEGTNQGYSVNVVAEQQEASNANNHSSSY